jgi:DNA-binding FadR family transcriptional regulator
VALDYDAVVTVSVAKQIAESVREAIIAGRIKVGERLPTEEDLARSYQVSRPTIREALKRLAAQNLVRSRRGPSGGNFVTRPDPIQAAHMLTGIATLLVGLGAFELEEIIAARLEAETLCCRLAAAVRTEEDVAAMEAELAIQHNSSLPDEEFCASDVRFHRALVDASGNGPLRFMMYVVIEAMLPITNLFSYRLRERRMTLDYHGRILAGLRAHDADRAVAALRDLIVYLGERCAEKRRDELLRSGAPMTDISQPGY